MSYKLENSHESIRGVINIHGVHYMKLRQPNVRPELIYEAQFYTHVPSVKIWTSRIRLFTSIRILLHIVA